MKIKTIEEIQEELHSWDLLSQLPSQIGEFRLGLPFEVKGLELVLARYGGPEVCSLEIAYTEETGDYIVSKNVGLFHFRDDRFYSQDRESFTERFLPVLSSVLGEIDRKVIQPYPYTAKSFEFDKWNFWRDLPREYAGFRMCISPDNPLKYLNGSYVLLAYEDRERANQLAIFYNEYRNEIFAELKRSGIFEYTKNFDVMFDDNRHGHNPKLFLKDAEDKIKNNLEAVLSSFA